MAALMEAVDLETLTVDKPSAFSVVQADSGAWTDAEVAEIAKLFAKADGDDARWQLSDLLVAKVPVGEVRGRKTGAHAALAELAERVGVSLAQIRAHRDTAHAWPPSARVDCAAWYVHAEFRDGGAVRAEWRREVLVGLERNPAGRITATALRRWRDEHDQWRDKRGRSTSRPVREAPVRRVPVDRPWADVAPEVARAGHEADRLLADVDALLIADAIPATVRVAMDALVAALTLLGDSLAGKMPKPARVPVDRPT